MIISFLLIALLQDGPVRTAPAAEPTLRRVEDCREPANRRPGEAELECIARFRTEAWRRSVQGSPADGFDWEAGAARQAEPLEPCDMEANRQPSETPFDCALRRSYEQRPAGRVGALGFPVAPEGADVPGWALSDPEAWEANQCVTAGDDACRRQARNRLAMARAGVASETPAAGPRADASQNCRMVMRRSEDGFGGSLSRVCGEGAESEAALDRLRDATRPEVETCDRPAALESQDAWIARCRTLPPR
jgi:hypothetical protein